MADDDSTNSFLSSLFSGGGGYNSAADLNAFQQQVRQDDIYTELAPLVSGTKFNHSTWSPTESMGVTAGQAFLSTILSGLGQQNEAEQMQKVVNVLPQLYADPTSVGVPEGVDSAPFNRLKMGLMNQQAATGADIKSAVMKEVFSKRPDMLRALIEANAPQASGVPSAPVEGAALAESMPSLASGLDSTAVKLRRYYQENLDANMPPTQAATAARQQVDGEIKANAKTFDEAKVAREDGLKLIDMANTARAGMQIAGKTGSFQGLRHVGDYIASTLGSEESTQKLLGDDLINQIAPDLVKMSRSPGAVTDYENRLYIGAGPSTSKTPESNAVFVQKMEDMGKLKVDYADFLDAYRQANSGSTTGAQQKWAEYRQAFPIFNVNPEELKLMDDLEKVKAFNRERPSWQEYFSGMATPQASGASMPTTSGAPVAGGVFNGERITGVTRIR